MEYNCWIIIEAEPNPPEEEVDDEWINWIDGVVAHVNEEDNDDGFAENQEVAEEAEIYDDDEQDSIGDVD